MGRFIAFGVPSTINVVTKGKEYDIKKVKEKIISDLSNFLDLSKYNCTEYDNGFVFKIKPKHFQDNVHELLKEIYPLIRCDNFLYGTKFQDINIMSDAFNKKDVPLIIKQFEKDEYGHRKGDFYKEWSKVEEDLPMEWPEFWIFKERELKRNVSIQMLYINLWRDWDKIFNEDDTNLICIMNTLLQGHFKSPLSKNCLFYISG